MKLPESVTIHPYTVKLRPDYEACRASGVTGQYVEDDLVIMYDDKRPPYIQADTLMHELLHAVWAQAGMNSVVDSTEAKSKGEQIIRALTPRLIALFRDNPGLMKVIVNGAA